jgi:hypothetical protein
MASMCCKDCRGSEGDQTQLKVKFWQQPWEQREERILWHTLVQGFIRPHNEFLMGWRLVRTEHEGLSWECQQMTLTGATGNQQRVSPHNHESRCLWFTLLSKNMNWKRFDSVQIPTRGRWKGPNPLMRCEERNRFWKSSSLTAGGCLSTITPKNPLWLESGHSPVN